MKQTLKNILGVSAIALFFYIVFSILSFAQAIPNTEQKQDKVIPQEEPKLYDLNRLILQQIPVYCGDTTFMFKTSAELMLESQILVGEVRQHGQPLGELLGILSFGHSVERDTGTFFMTIPGVGPGGESLTCILGFGTNWTFFNDDGSKIVIGNSL